MVEEEDKLLKFFEALQIVIEIVISKFLPDLANIEFNFPNKYNISFVFVGCKKSLCFIKHLNKTL